MADGQHRVVLVGCGAAKRNYWEWPTDVDGALQAARESFWQPTTESGGFRYPSLHFLSRFEEAVSEGYPEWPAEDLYTSTYFGLKQPYANLSGDAQGVLSAEHGLLPFHEHIEPYDTAMDDRDPETWADEVMANADHPSLRLHEATRIDVLAGRDYVDPLRDRFDALDADVYYPFQEEPAAQGGNGYQMGWLSDQLDDLWQDAVNGWTHAPDYRYNGDVWLSPDGDTAVVVFASPVVGGSYVRVSDERVQGAASSETIAPRDTDATASELSPGEARRAALAWMREHAPADWSHPRVGEAVFDAPPGYEFVTAYVEARDTTVVYHRRDAPARQRLAGAGRPAEVTPETYPYLVVHTWAGSGNSTVSLAPWRRAHDHEREEVAAPPEECGLDVALATAREYAREHVSGPDDARNEPTRAGQTSRGECDQGRRSA